MVSATDVITCIGVPLAVLGVTPIFYTFAVALYTRLKLQRVLHKNDIEPRIRARLMTGVVEVDLPVFQLEPLSRTDDLYWKGAVPKTIDGASWNRYNWFSRETDFITSRLQRSDNITLPEAKIDFGKLIDYLQDRGAVIDVQGFRVLRTRGQQATAGTALMRNPSGGKLVLELTKPGDHHGSISFKLARTLWGLTSRDEPTALHPSSITGLLPQLQPEVAPLIANHSDPSVQTPNDSDLSVRTPTNGMESGYANAIANQQRSFFIDFTPSGTVNVSVAEQAAPSKTTNLGRDHLQHLNAGKEAFWRSWFACAAVAVLRPKYIRPFEPSELFLRTAQQHTVKLRTAVQFQLIDPLRIFYSNPEYHSSDIGSALTASQPREVTERSHEVWATIEDVELLAKYLPRPKMLLRMLGYDRIMSILEKHIAVPILMQTCINVLLSSPTRFISQSTTLPELVLGSDGMLQHSAERIVYSLIFDVHFAEGVKSQIERSMQETSEVRPNVKHDRDLIFGAPKTRPSRKELQYFCSAMILFMVIGQRADFLL